MPLNDLVSAAIAHTRGLPVAARYVITLVIVLVLLALRLAASPVLPPSAAFLVFFLAVLLSSALFDRGTGLFATGLSAALVDYVDLPPTGSLLVGDGRSLLALGLFCAIAGVMAVIIESLHRALAQAHEANAGLLRAHGELMRVERSRALLLREFRHRTRNDLGSLVGVLHLRARTATSEAAREGLREAAQHAMALARVHTWLAAADGNDMAVIDTREFVLGLCADLDAARAGEGLRPVSLLPEAEAHVLDAERAVQLGLVLNEAVTNAMKYAFPEDRAGMVHVAFLRDGEMFVLRVADDGIGLPREDDIDGPPSAPAATGLGTRLLRGLAAQLRGSFIRRPGEGGVGTVAELRFPTQSPAAAPVAPQLPQAIVAAS